jgi:GTP pyrophosphokinase
MCTGAKVNGRIVTLDSQLATRDVVEIITQKSAHPKRGWLDIVITAKAKQHIRAYFRRSDYDNNRTEGERTVAEELDILGYSVKDFTEQQIKEALSETSFKSLDDMYASVGAGITTPRQAVRIILGKSYSAVFTQEKTSTSKKKEPSKTDFKGLKIFIAPCCEPKKTDKVICYVTRGRGLAVHRADCTNVSSLEERRVFKYNP